MLDDLLSYVRGNARVCPMPQKWNDLWSMLPDRHRLDGGWEPPLPLILAPWSDTPALAKMLRLEEHIRYADAKNALGAVDTFLRALPEADWTHLGDF